MRVADEYFNNIRQIIEQHPELIMKKARYQVFGKRGGILVGANKAVNFIKENTYGPIRVLGYKDGCRFKEKEPILVIEGYGRELLNLETTYLGFLSYSGCATNMRDIVQEANGVPVIDMAARHYPWQVIEETAQAAYLGGAAGTSTEEGYNAVQTWYNAGDKFKLYASLPHAAAALVAELAEEKGVYPSVMAGILFNQYFPKRRPVTVLVDYEGLELDVARQAYKILGDNLGAVRLDTNGARKMQGTHEDSRAAREYLKAKGVDFPEELSKYYIDEGVTVEATYVMREFLDSIGAKDVKIIVSSGFNKKKTRAFAQAGAPMDSIGTGSYVEFDMFTSDISHVEEKGKWVYRAKAGRDYGDSLDKYELLFERK